MAINFKENMVVIGGKEMKYHDFESGLFKGEFSGEETVQSNILTDGKSVILKETNIWKISRRILAASYRMDEFSQRLRAEIEKLIIR